MKRIIASLAAVAMLAGAAPALAGPVNVTPKPTTFTLSGAVTVSQSVTLNCNLSLNVSVDASNNITITGGALTAGDSLCPSVVLTNFNWPTTVTAPAASGTGPATQLAVANFRANTLTGNCQGTLTVAWNNTTKQATINSTVPGTSVFAPKACTIQGVLNSSNPNISIVRT